MIVKITLIIIIAHHFVSLLYFILILLVLFWIHLRAHPNIFFLIRQGTLKKEVFLSFCSTQLCGTMAEKNRLRPETKVGINFFGYCNRMKKRKNLNNTPEYL